MGKILGRNETVKEPESEALGFLVDGSSTPVRIIPKKAFVKIERSNISLKWTNTQKVFSWGEFADGDLLGTGIGLEYNKVKKFDQLVKDNHDWHKYSGVDAEINADTKTVGLTNRVSLTSRISFFRWHRGGFDMRNSELALVINDDMTAAGLALVEATIIFQGWIWSKRDERKIKI